MKHTATAVVIASLLVACSSAEPDDGIGIGTQGSEQNIPHSDVAASAAEALTVVDLGPLKNVQTKQPITLQIQEQPDGSTLSQLTFVANATGYRVAIALGDPLNRTEWSIGAEGLDVVAGVSLENLEDTQVVRMQSGVVTAAVEADRATITVNNASAAEMETALTGSVAGKLVRSCHTQVPSKPGLDGNRPAEATMSELDPEWDSEFCQRYAD